MQSGTTTAPRPCSCTTHGHGDKTRGRARPCCEAPSRRGYRLSQDPGGLVLVESMKMKDAAQPAPMAFKMTPVELGLTDSLNRPVTSAVLEPTNWSSEAAAPEPKGKHQRTALEALQDLESEHRQRLEMDGRDPETARVELHVWRQRCMDRGVPWTKVYEARNALAKRGLAGYDSAFIWTRRVP